MKYADLVDEIEQNGFTVELVPIEIGAQGFLKYESFRWLNEVLGADRKEFFTLLMDVAKVTIYFIYFFFYTVSAIAEDT